MIFLINWQYTPLGAHINYHLCVSALIHFSKVGMVNIKQQYVMKIFPRIFTKIIAT